jgi:hypothetical protein
MDIEMARLLCLKAAWMMDQGDARAAAPWISQIKVVAPKVALKVTDEAVQMFGAPGHQPGHAAGALVDASAHAALRRRARRRAPPPDRADRTEEVHAGESVMHEGHRRPRASRRSTSSNMPTGPSRRPPASRSSSQPRRSASISRRPLVQGLYQMKPPTPFVPGMEVAGAVSRSDQGHTAQVRATASPRSRRSAVMPRRSACTTPSRR